MKLILFISAIILGDLDDGIIKQIKKITKGKAGKELKIEIEEVFNRIENNYGVNLNLEDTLFIIRGIDIQDRSAYGRIWNKQHQFHFHDKKQRIGTGLLSPNPEISDEVSVTEDFDKLIGFIEKGEKGKVIDFSKSNPVLSGVSWTIVTFKINKEGKYNTDIYSIDDFVDIESINKK